mgnify:CR=1 FL=1
MNRILNQQFKTELSKIYPKEDLRINVYDRQAISVRLYNSDESDETEKKLNAHLEEIKRKLDWKNVYFIINISKNKKPAPLAKGHKIHGSRLLW